MTDLYADSKYKQLAVEYALKICVTATQSTNASVLISEAKVIEEYLRSK